MQLYYTLDGHTVRPCDMFEANEILADIDRRRVGRDTVGDWVISTMFTVFDENPVLDTPTPWVFETAVFPGEPGPSHSSLWKQRYSTWGEAEAGHQEVIRQIQAGGLSALTSGVK